MPCASTAPCSLRDASNLDYRLGLARALAWGDHPREAEIELRALQAKRVQPATIDTLLRLVREAIEPRVSEAATWVAERRDYAPYRLAYARALAREHYSWIASAQYDSLIAGAGEGTIPEPWCCVASRRMRSSTPAISPGGAARLRDVLRMAPARHGGAPRVGQRTPRTRIEESRRARSTTP